MERTSSGREGQGQASTNSVGFKLNEFWRQVPPSQSGVIPLFWPGSILVSDNASLENELKMIHTHRHIHTKTHTHTQTEHVCKT